MIDFARASRVEPLGDGRFRAAIPDGWQQGRGAFGGLVLAVLLRAIEATETERPVRTLLGDLLGPVVPGPADLRCRVLRRGHNQSNVAAELSQGGHVLATVSAVLSTARRVSAPELVPVPPAPESAGEVPLITMAPPVAPVFTQHYEYRTHQPPFAGTGEAGTTEGWLVERAPLSRVDAPALIGRLDAWWPTLFALDSMPRPMATVSFAAQIFVAPETLAPNEPLRYRARMAALHDGFFVELRELWQGGRPVALNQQTFVILK